MCQHTTSSDLSDGEGDDDDEYLSDNGLRVSTFGREVESVQLYRVNHLHPVLLGDSLNDRYKVLHKLGHGGFATIWLCLDTNRSATSSKYVAIKILAAHASRTDTACSELNVEIIAGLDLAKEDRDLFGLPLTKFEIEGPNGRHLAVVYPVFGPPVAKLGELPKAGVTSSSALSEICRQATRAMAILHANELCHGDFRPSNILTRIHGINNLSERQITGVFGPPDLEQVTESQSRKAHDRKTAPQYMVLDTYWPALRKASDNKVRIGKGIALIDFGESFRISNDNDSPSVGTPSLYLPPEYILDGKAGLNTDLWALGCTLFEIRTDTALFGTWSDGDDEQQLIEIVKVLGPLPEPYWSTTWKDRKKYFHDKPDSKGQAVQISESGTTTTSSHQTDRSLIQKLERCLYGEIRRSSNKQRAVLRKEMELFASLLSELLRYNPADRISATQALKHPWFELSH